MNTHSIHIKKYFLGVPLPRRGVAQVGLSAISFARQKDAAAIPNAKQCFSKKINLKEVSATLSSI